MFNFKVKTTNLDTTKIILVSMIFWQKMSAFMSFFFQIPIAKEWKRLHNVLKAILVAKLELKIKYKRLR